ncbi:hypothetical protein MTO96_034044 [Rhipicephalus appendiculatus]
MTGSCVRRAAQQARKTPQCVARCVQWKEDEACPETPLPEAFVVVAIALSAVACVRRARTVRSENAPSAAIHACLTACCWPAHGRARGRAARAAQWKPRRQRDTRYAACGIEVAEGAQWTAPCRGHSFA